MKIVFLLPGPPSIRRKAPWSFVEQFLRPPARRSQKQASRPLAAFSWPLLAHRLCPTTMPYRADRNLTLEIKALLFISV